MKPLIKICGITRHEDVILCEGLGADFLGFIFHPASPRCATLDFARSIKISTMRKVGVFVQQSASEVLSLMSKAGLDFAQLHGSQNVEFCRTIGPEKVIKVLWPQRYDSEAQLQAEILRFAPYCRYLLFDAGKSGGGHGTQLNLKILNKVDIPCEWLLAGGLEAGNIKHILTQVHPTGIDLNSGVESQPGIKDEIKLQAVFDIMDSL